MEVVSSQGKPRQLRHAALGLEHSINGGGQAIVEPFDQDSVVAMALRAGEFSLPHTLARHRSAPNCATHRRIGLGISYIPAQVRTIGLTRLFAMPVRGRDTGGDFDLWPAPRSEFDPADLERHDQVYQRYRRNYAEPIAAHDRQFAAA